MKLVIVKTFWREGLRGWQNVRNKGMEFIKILRLRKRELEK